MTRMTQALLLLGLMSAALFSVTCGGSGGSCGGQDGGLLCVDVCADLDEFRRFPCDKAPFNLCDAQQNPVRPLNSAQLDYVVEKCRTCSGCSKSCESCSSGLPPH